MWWIYLIFLIIGFITYACCVVSGRAEEASRKYYEEHYEKDYYDNAFKVE